MISSITPNPKNVSISEYCKNPENYKNTLSNTTIKYYNSVCLNMKNPPSGNTSGLLLSGLSNTGKGIANVIQGMLTPEGLLMLGILIGGSILTKYSNTLVEQAVKDLLPIITKIGAQIAEKEIVPVTGALITTIGNVTVYSAFASVKILNFALDVVDYFNWPLLILTIIAAIFDAWDPCDLNSVLGREKLMEINESLNENFQEKIIKSGSFKNEQGDVEYVNKYPIEYYSDSILYQYESEYTYKLTLYSFYYLNNLIYNSKGELIENKPMDLPTQKDISILTKSTVYWLADGNIVVYNWISKWAPLIIVAVLCVFLILFLL
jgi:hypothetical protein